MTYRFETLISVDQSSPYQIAALKSALVVNNLPLNDLDIVTRDYNDYLVLVFDEQVSDYLVESIIEQQPNDIIVYSIDTMVVDNHLVPYQWQRMMLDHYKPSIVTSDNYSIYDNQGNLANHYNLDYHINGNHCLITIPDLPNYTEISNKVGKDIVEFLQSSFRRGTIVNPTKQFIKDWELVTNDQVYYYASWSEPRISNITIALWYKLVGYPIAINWTYTLNRTRHLINQMHDDVRIIIIAQNIYTTVDSYEQLRNLLHDIDKLPIDRQVSVTSPFKRSTLVNSIEYNDDLEDKWSIQWE